MPHWTNSLDFSRPRAFMFDLDGTILDSTPWHMKAYRETLTAYAPYKLSEFSEDLIKGRGSKDVFLALGFTDNKEVSKLVEYKRKLYRSSIQNKKVRLFDGVTDLINILKSRHRILILVTSSSNNTATLILEANGLTGVFNHIVTQDKVKFGKPEPDIFKYALQCAHLNPLEAVTIEDSYIGIQASIAAGIPAVLVNQEKDFPNILTFRTFTDLRDHVSSYLEKD